MNLPNKRRLPPKASDENIRIRVNRALESKGVENYFQAKYYAELSKFINQQPTKKFDLLKPHIKVHDTQAWETALEYCLAYLKNNNQTSTISAIQTELAGVKVGSPGLFTQDPKSVDKYFANLLKISREKLPMPFAKRVRMSVKFQEKAMNYVNSNTNDIKSISRPSTQEQAPDLPLPPSFAMKDTSGENVYPAKIKSRSITAESQEEEDYSYGYEEEDYSLDSNQKYSYSYGYSYTPQSPESQRKQPSPQVESVKSLSQKSYNSQKSLNQNITPKGSQNTPQSYSVKESVKSGTQSYSYGEESEQDKQSNKSSQKSNPQNQAAQASEKRSYGYSYNQSLQSERSPGSNKSGSSGNQNQSSGSNNNKQGSSDNQSLKSSGYGSRLKSLDSHPANPPQSAGKIQPAFQSSTSSEQQPPQNQVQQIQEKSAGSHKSSYISGSNTNSQIPYSYGYSYGDEEEDFEEDDFEEDEEEAYSTN